MLAHQFGVLLDRLAHRTKDDAQLRQFVFEAGRHGNRVHDKIHCHAGEALLLLEADAQLVHGSAQFRIHLVHAIELLLLLRRCVVADGLVVGLLIVEVGPIRLLHGLPHRERLQAPLQQPFRLLFLGGNQPDDVL